MYASAALLALGPLRCRTCTAEIRGLVVHSTAPSVPRTAVTVNGTERNVAPMSVKDGASCYVISALPQGTCNSPVEAPASGNMFATRSS